MGRWSTGALCTVEVMRLEMSHLISLGLKQDVERTWRVSWTGGGSIAVYCNTQGIIPFLELHYTITYRDGEERKMKYRVNMVRKASNLGKGFRFYFLCPFSGHAATILYKAYNSEYFKHRKAYPNRIYYEQQMEGKRFRGLDTAPVRRRIRKLESKRKQESYKGQRTKRSQKLDELERKLWHLECLLSEMLIRC